MRRTLNRRIVLVILCSISGILLFINIFNSFTSSSSSLSAQTEMLNKSREYETNSLENTQNETLYNPNNSIEEVVDQEQIDKSKIHFFEL